VRVAGGGAGTERKRLEPDVLHLFFQLSVEVESELLGRRIVARIFSSQQQDRHFYVEAQKFLGARCGCSNRLVVHNGDASNEEDRGLKYEPGFHLCLT
jgi:hypothetical protein